MKIQNYVLAILILISFNSFAQESPKSGSVERNEDFQTLHVNGEHRKGLRLLDFFRKDSRFSASGLAELATIQINTNNSNYSNNNQRKSFNGSSIPVVYYDGDLILGDGINRLYLIDQVKLSKIKTISKSLKERDTPIYVVSMPK